MPARRQRAGGFSLIEMMIAVTVILVGILTAFSSQFAALRVVDTSRDTNTAMAELLTAMEQILILSHDEIPLPAGPYPQGQPIPAFEGRRLEDEHIVPTFPGYSGGPEIPDPLQIVLTITWSDSRGRARTLQIASMKAK